MKNLILPIAIATILLTSCSKDETLEQTELQTINSVYVLNQINDNVSWDTVVLDNQQMSANYDYNPYITYRDHTEGLFMSPPQNGMTIQWTGTQTDHGSSGVAEFKQITPYINLHFKMETECIKTESNQAVYGGVITQVIELTGGAPLIEVGWRFYFKVIDNGEGGVRGGIIPYDKISNMTIFAPPGIPLLCNSYSPSSYIWSSQGYTDVIEPGFLEVDNYEAE